MREMNYHPSAVARGLSRKRMNAIGVVFPHEYYTFLGNPFVGPVLDGILEVATRSHQNVTLFTGQIWSDTAHSLSLYCDGRCDGMILISPPEGSDIVPALLERGVPFLLIGSSAEQSMVSSVDIDNVQAAKSLVAYLIEQGHRRIAYMGGHEKMQSTRLRYEGYRQALLEAGIPFAPDLVLDGYYQLESGYARGQALTAWPAENRPTAVFCGSDEIALGALQALKEGGLAVPRDISVVGFDDIALAAVSDPPLTTVRQPLRRLGERGAEILFARINERKTAGHREAHSAELILRESVAPVRNGPKSI
jgi:LacI family transcriptional regulator